MKYHVRFWIGEAEYGFEFDWDGPNDLLQILDAAKGIADKAAAAEGGEAQTVTLEWL
jgi:hypothetical protein